MPAYKFAASAEDDLSDITGYTLATWGAQQTVAYLDGLERLAAVVARNPKLGKACEKLGAGLRAIPYQSHILYYLTEPRYITIVRVLHQSMNPSLHFSGAPDD